MSQNLKSSDEPRIVDDFDSLFWEKYKTLLIAAPLVLIAAVAGLLLWWNAKATRNLEALSIYAGATSAESWKKVVDLYPSTPSAALAYIQLASDAQSKNAYEEAAGYYAAFLKNFPRHPAASAVQFGRAQALQAAGKTAEAKTAYEEIINARPESAFFGGASVALAKLYQAEKDLPRARQILESFTTREQASTFTPEARKLLAGLGAANAAK